MNVIIFGPPGAGKGTQALNIVNKFDLYQINNALDVVRSGQGLSGRCIVEM